MSEAWKVKLESGQVWWVNSSGFSPRDAEIVIPIDNIGDLSDEAIGRAVRTLIPSAELCCAMAIAGEIFRVESYLDSPYIGEWRDYMELYAIHSEDIREAIDIIDGKKPHPHAIARKQYKPQLKVQPGYIYLLKSDHGYKIGKTKRLPERMKHFDIKLPYPVELIHTIATENMVQAETALHKRFVITRINGEWFDLQPDDIAYITSLETL